MNKNIYFFWDKPDSMPNLYKLNIDIARAIHPDYSVTLYSLEDAEILIRNFDSELMDIFSKVTPPACKSDIFRLVILYLNGGWYLDCDLKLIRRLEYIELAEKNTVFIRGESNAPITNMALFFQKESEVLLKMIELIKSYYRYEIYNNDVWSFTGPGIFNVFYNDDSFNKKSFTEFFTSGRSSTFTSITTKASTSWKYQQCFGVYKSEFNAVKFRHGNELLKAMNYAISLGKPETLNKLIQVNAGNLLISYSQEHIQLLSVKSLIMIFNEIGSDNILQKAILKAGVTDLEFDELKQNLSIQQLREMALSNESENIKKSVFLIFFATILKPNGPIIRKQLENFKKDSVLKHYIDEWNGISNYGKINSLRNFFKKTS